MLQISLKLNKILKEEWIESYYEWMALPWLSMIVKLELFSTTDTLK